MNQLIKGMKLVPLITVAAGAAGTTVLTSSIIDFAGYEGALILVPLGPVVAGAVTSIKFQQGAASDMSDAADVVGTNVAIADTDDNTIKYLEIRRPMLQYGQIVVSRATQAATVCAYALLYGSRNRPTSQIAGAVGKSLVSPAAGTP